MKRRPFTLKEPPTLKRFLKTIPFVVAWLVLAPLIAMAVGPHVDSATLLFVEFAFMIVLIVVHVRTGPRLTTLSLLQSPCPQCGKKPMRFDRSSEGDCAFICDRCQTEWTITTK
jgi:hypothetical protein